MAATAATAAAQEAKKSVDNTVFVRFLPPSDAIRRHHVEDLFSDCGPIKKSSVIHAGGGGKDGQPVTSSYGFVKYTVPEDAALAAMKLNNRTLKVADGVVVTVKVELAKTDHTAPKSKRKQAFSTTAEDQPRNEEPEDEAQKKKTNRLILRNLSFYAKESDIRKALTPFGELLEVHIPRVEAKGTTHRGFCFVTFATEKAVKKCLAAKEPLVIKERTVNMARSLHKTAYQSQHQPAVAAKESETSKKAATETSKEMSKKEKHSDDGDDDDDDDDEETTGSDDDDSSNDNESESGSGDEEDMDDDKEDDDSDKEDDDSAPPKQKRTQTDDKTAVAEKRCLFLRNLPFDCTRHDVFESFRPFGFITSIYIVKDKETNKIPKGTAFVSFQRPDQAAKALEFAAAVGSSNFISQRSTATTTTVEDQWENNNRGSVGGGIVLNGRRLLVDLAVDKETATTLTVTEKKQGEAGGKDRRNLYLKGEGRVENDEKAGVLTWDELPEGDKLKRQTAWSEKNTKLRSPLFFINPNRLSIRNLAKHVDEAALKAVIVEATMRGLSNGLVSAEDQIAHWRAAGEMSTRDILTRIQQAAGDGDSARAVIPAFDEKNVKQSIPSLHIHRDVAPGGNKKLAPSRGFGFVEFEHHVHALACLRELNNNTLYSAEYATGGKQAMEMKRRRAGKKKQRDKPSTAPTEEGDEGLVGEDGRVRIPRLIVELTVENKAKAKQQAEHKAQQQANLVKQREELKTDPDKHVGKKTKKEKKKSRGAAQREKKRKQHEYGEDATDQSPSDKEADTAIAAPASEPSVKKVKGVKPPKKQKVDKEEENFSKLVESYKQQAIAIMGTTDDSTTVKSGRRWFE